MGALLHPTPLVGAVGQGSVALWYLTRATGLVALALLTATLVVGMVASVGWTTERWPRFASQTLHRNLSLLCLALVLVHVLTTVVDGYVPIDLIDAVVPFRSPYRPLYVGFGALAFDLVVAVAITSGLRRFIGTRAWRAVHWAAYACWPVALAHGLGSGTDARSPVGLAFVGSCTLAVAVTVCWRLIAAPRVPSHWKVAGTGATGAVLAALALFALWGPLRPGWSSRSGTSTRLLAQLDHTPSQAASARAGVVPNHPSGRRSRD